MDKIWSRITEFNFLFLLASWILDRSRNPSIPILMIDIRQESLPIFVLSVGSLATILSFYLFYLYAKDHLHREWIERIPPLSTEVYLHTRFAKFCGGFIIVICILFPLAAQVHFWQRFHVWKAWSNHEPSKDSEVSLYKLVSPGFLLDWDAHRYGDLDKKPDKEHQGVSYVPFWQPILMMLATGVVFYLGIMNIYLILKKRSY